MSHSTKVREVRKGGDIEDAVAVLESTGAQEEDIRSFREYLQEQGSAVFVISTNGQPVGTVLVRSGDNLPDEQHRHGMTVFSHLAVRPQQRRKGYGLMLLEVIEDYAKDVHESFAVSTERPETGIEKNLFDLYGMDEDPHGFMFAAIEEFSPEEYILREDGSVDEEEFLYRKELRESTRKQRKEKTR